MNPLQSRKLLLLAESELNRAQLVQEWETLTEEVRAIGGRAKSFDEIASSAAVLVAALAAFRRARPVQAGPKPSWLRTILRGASMCFTLWRAFRSPKGDRD